MTDRGGAAQGARRDVEQRRVRPPCPRLTQQGHAEERQEHEGGRRGPAREQHGLQPQEAPHEQPVQPGAGPATDGDAGTVSEPAALRPAGTPAAEAAPSSPLTHHPARPVLTGRQPWHCLPPSAPGWTHPAKPRPPGVTTRIFPTSPRRAWAPHRPLRQGPPSASGGGITRKTPPASTAPPPGRRAVAPPCDALRCPRDTAPPGGNGTGGAGAAARGAGASSRRWSPPQRPPACTGGRLPAAARPRDPSG